MGILIIAEHDNHHLSARVLPVISAARQLGGQITLLVAGHQCHAVAEAARQVAGISRVLLAEAAHYEHGLAEELAPLLVRAVSADTRYILAASTTFGKNLLPRVAALLDVAQISDIVRIVSPDTFIRPIHAGNVLATVQTRDPIKVITVRTTAFDPAATSGGNAVVDTIEATPVVGLSRFVDSEIHASERPDLTTARVVVSGGRGLGTAENFRLLEALADKLGAAVGASRAAVDAGYISNDHQVGQTGKVVAPELYIAVGISGAIQHLAGMKDSKVIVAINKDRDAPIFAMADYGLVADLFQVLPEFTEALDAIKQTSGG
jgi:electron transfer flavoprotein alpha subunit